MKGSIYGRLTKDPESKQTKNGKTMCNFTVAESYYNGSENKTSFVYCVAFGKTAENICKHFSKGNRFLGYGEGINENYTNEAGEKKTVFKVMVQSFEFVESRQDGHTEQSQPENDVSDDFVF